MCVVKKCMHLFRTAQTQTQFNLALLLFTFFASPKKVTKKGDFCRIAPRDKRGYTLGAQSFYHLHGAGF